MKKGQEKKKTRRVREERKCFISCFLGRGVEDRKSAAVCFRRKTVTSDAPVRLSVLFCHQMQNYTMCWQLVGISH